MRASALKSISLRKKAGALFLPFYEGGVPAFADKGLAPLYKGAIATGDFTGIEEQTLLQYVEKGIEERIVLVGLGKEPVLNGEKVRRAYAAALVLIKTKAESINLIAPPGYEAEALQGALLASYSYQEHKEKKKKSPKKIVLLGGDSALAEREELLANSVFLARDLVMGNADDVTPERLAQCAGEIAALDKRASVTLFDRKQICDMGMGLLTAVSRASAVEPRLICLEYRGNPKSKELTALVGKGITFDTGGLLIKPRGGMETMRDDMGGAAAVLGAIHSAITRSLPINLVGVIPCTENGIGPESYKPGDVYKSYAGISVEINDTDAEGRLVLADALSYTEQTYKPTRIIDIATLTGGVIVALGDEVSGYMSNDDQLAGQLFAAGEATYERLWRFPLYKEYEGILKSNRADLKNSGVRKASSIQGGTFLKHFVKKTPWAHIDIGGSAFHDPLRPYNPVEATGMGVRLFTTFFESLLAND